MRAFRSIFLFFLLLGISFSASRGQGFLETLQKRFTAYKQAAPKERVFIITDRDVYASGEPVWFDAVVYDIFSPMISEISNELEVHLYNQDNSELRSKKFKVDQGRAHGFFRLPAGIPDGVYYLTGETNNSKGTDYYFSKILLKKKIVPQFVLEANFPDKAYIPGDEIPLNIRFRDFYNEPIRNVMYQIEFFDGEKKVPGPSGKVKKEGMASIQIKIPQSLKSGLFTYRIYARSKGMESRLSGKFPVLSNKMFVDFFPENGKLIHGIRSKINFFAYDACGEPLTIEADLLENGNVVKTFFSDHRGLGAIDLQPSADKDYYVQIKRPLLLDRQYDLPDVKKKGVALKVHEKTSSTVTYNLISSYVDPRLVYFIGVSEGKIFWASEHEIEKEARVEIDLSKSRGKLAHFIVANAAARIEGEHILAIPHEKALSPGMMATNPSPEPRGVMEYEIKGPITENPEIVFSSVNTPWLVEPLSNQNILAVSLPYDLEQQLVFQTKAFHNSDFSYEQLETYVPYYIPYGFGWDRVLSTTGAFHHKILDPVVMRNKVIADRMLVECEVEVSEGKVKHTNLVAGDYFATSNPKYILKLHEAKKERKPAYITMLENGTPVLEVLQSIKPYNLQGSHIVFYGSANSLNFQGGALIAIDGLNRGTDASILNNINPYDIQKIFVSTNPNDIQRYTGLNSVGLIEITLKKGDEGKVDDEKEFEEDMQFEAPDYTKRKHGAEEDYRSTLFWKVKTIGNKEGYMKVLYCNSDLISKVKGKIYVIPKTGTPSVSSFEYVIK